MATTVAADTWKEAQYGLGTAGTPVDFDADPIYMMLVTATGDSVADATKQGYKFVADENANEVSGTGYTAGGVQLSSAAISVASHVVKITFANPSWTTATITASGAYVFKRVGGSLVPASDTLIGYWTFGSSVVSTAGTFSVTINASGLITNT